MNNTENLETSAAPVAATNEAWDSAQAPDVEMLKVIKTDAYHRVLSARAELDRVRGDPRARSADASERAQYGAEYSRAFDVAAAAEADYAPADVAFDVAASVNGEVTPEEILRKFVARANRLHWNGDKRFTAYKEWKFISGREDGKFTLTVEPPTILNYYYDYDDTDFEVTLTGRKVTIVATNKEYDLIDGLKDFVVDTVDYETRR